MVKEIEERKKRTENDLIIYKELKKSNEELQRVIQSMQNDSNSSSNKLLEKVRKLEVEHLDLKTQLKNLQAQHNNLNEERDLLKMINEQV